MNCRLAILHDPADPEPPSNPAALQKFLQAAAALDIEATLVTRDEIAPLHRFDALFIRDTTHAHHYTHQLAQQAAAAGLAVIDDAESIRLCNDKIYQARLFQRHGLPAPRTLVLDRDGLGQVSTTLGLPCVLKLPDSSFSTGVVKVEHEGELRQQGAAMFRLSAEIVAQEFLPTAFDWRIGILDRQPLFVCQYHMVPGYWQIIRHEADGTLREGITRALPLEQTPPDVLALALRAANLIGDGFYGVDIKQVEGRCLIIEINDNPNVDAGNEDGVLGDELYRRIMASLLRRAQARI